MSNARLLGSSLAFLLFGAACLLPACAMEAPEAEEPSEPEEIGSAQSALAVITQPSSLERCKNDCYYAWHVCINACQRGPGASRCIEACNDKQTQCEAKCKPDKNGNFRP